MKLLYVQAIILVINNMVNFQSYQLSILLNVALMSLAVICCLGQPRKTRGVARPLAVAGEKKHESIGIHAILRCQRVRMPRPKTGSWFRRPVGSAGSFTRAAPVSLRATRARAQKKKKKRRGNHRLRCWVVAFLPFGAQLRTNPHHARARGGTLACIWLRGEIGERKTRGPRRLDSLHSREASDVGGEGGCVCDTARVVPLSLADDSLASTIDHHHQQHQPNHSLRIHAEHICCFPFHSEHPGFFGLASQDDSLDELDSKPHPLLII